MAIPGTVARNRTRKRTWAQLFALFMCAAVRPGSATEHYVANERKIRQEYKKARENQGGAAGSRDPAASIPRGRKPELFR